MKRMLSILLALCLSLTVSAVLAETVTTTLVELDNGLTIVIEHEENITIQATSEFADSGMFWTIEDSEHAPVTLCIASSEIDSQLSLADLTAEEQMMYGEQVGAMFSNPEIHLDTTPSGNQYLHICSNEESDIDTIFTIYKGYFVELVQFDDAFGQLSEEDQNFLLSVLHGIEFIFAE